MKKVLILGLFLLWIFSFLILPGKGPNLVEAKTSQAGSPLKGTTSSSDPNPGENSSLWHSKFALDENYITGIGDPENDPAYGNAQKTCWASGNSNTWPKWWMVNLGTSHTIDQVIVYPNEAYQPKEVWIVTSVDGATFRQQGVRYTFLSNSRAPHSFYFSPVSAHYIRVMINGNYPTHPLVPPEENHYVSLAEVEIYEEKTGPILSEPFNGAIFNERYPDVSPEAGFQVWAKGTAVPNSTVYINGAPVTASSDGSFQKAITLKNGLNTITASRNGVTQETKIYFDEGSFRRYHVSVDDVIHLLWDLTQNNYPSLFDQPELKFLKQMHDSYGTKFSLYLDHTEDRNAPDANATYDDPFPSWNGFTLSQVPEKYKAEWQQNADWLKLGFHVRNECNYWPYVVFTRQDTGSPYNEQWYNFTPEERYSTAFYEYKLVKDEVERFASSEVWDDFPRIHFYSGSKEAIRAWKELGLKGVFSAYTNLSWSFDEAPVHSGWKGYENSAYLPIGSLEWLYSEYHNYWYDPEMEIFFLEADLWTDVTSKDKIRWHLDQISQWGATDNAEIIEVYTHDHLPYAIDNPEAYALLGSNEGKARIKEAITWLVEHNYKPVHYSEGFLGKASFIPLSSGWNEIAWPDVSGKKASDTPVECPIAVAKENFWFKPYVKNFGGVNFNFENGKTYYIKCNQEINWSL